MWGTLCESDLYNALPAIHATLATIGATLLILCLSLRDCLPIHISKIKKKMKLFSTLYRIDEIHNYDLIIYDLGLKETSSMRNVFD